MRVAIVLPTYRRVSCLERCLAGIARQRRPADEVLVVYRPEEDPETKALVAAMSERAQLPIRGIEVYRPGLVHALEAGAAAARADVVAATDDDAVPRPDWLARLMVLYADGVGGVGGRDVIHTPTGTLGGQANVVGQVAWFGRVVGNHHVGHGLPRRVQVLKGVNMSFRKELWKFEYTLAGRGAQVHSELFLSLRVRRLGWDVLYDPEAMVDHYPAYRPEGDARGLWQPADVEAASYNATLALVAYAPTWQGVVRAGYRVLVGDFGAPGPVRAGLALLQRRPEAIVGMRPAMRGAIRAIAVRLGQHWPAQGGDDA